MSDKPLQPLSDEQVDGIAGGYLHCTGDESDERPWQIIDDRGDVVESYKTYYEAYYFAHYNGYATNEINSKELEKLKTTGWPW